MALSRLAAFMGSTVSAIQTFLAAADAASARAAIGAAEFPVNTTITQFNGITTPISVAQGGTGTNTSTGSGSVVLATAPTLTTPNLGTPSTINLSNATGQLPGFRNRLRNASFAINQRSLTGTVTLAAGAYGHDGVKAGASGATYTFAASGLDTTITISAGSLILPIETALIEGGVYTLSQAGTAQARVWQGTGSTGSGSYAACPFTTASLTANTQTNVEFSTGTVLRPQFEPGAVATGFERRPPGAELSLCQRYYFRATAATSYAPFALGPGVSSTDMRVVLYAPIPMRSAPTMTSGGSFIWAFGNAVSALALAAATTGLISIDCTTTGLTAGGCYTLTDGGSANAWIAGSAELA